MDLDIQLVIWLVDYLVNQLDLFGSGTCPEILKETRKSTRDFVFRSVSKGFSVMGTMLFRWLWDELKIDEVLLFT